jgi:hypothetical protein
MPDESLVGKDDPAAELYRLALQGGARFGPTIGGNREKYKVQSTKYKVSEKYRQSTKVQKCKVQSAKVEEPTC